MEWNVVDAASVPGFLTRWLAPRSVSAAGRMASVLRALLRFAFIQDWIGEDLGDKGPTTAAASGSSPLVAVFTRPVARALRLRDLGMPCGRDRSLVCSLSGDDRLLTRVIREQRRASWGCTAWVIVGDGRGGRSGHRIGES